MANRSKRLRWLLATTSAAALLTAAAPDAARAACSTTITGSSTGFTNPAATTIPCIEVSAATVSGNVVNAGTITPGSTPTGDGIAVLTNSTITGTVSNSGTISVAHAGILSAFSTIAGGITNSGSITAIGASAITVFATSTFAGGIVNSGTLNGHNGILTNVVFTFSGGITNAGGGSITATNGIGIEAIGSNASPATFLGGVTNAGSITANGAIAGSNGIGIKIFSRTGIGAPYISTFSGGVINSGNITAQNTGIFVTDVTTFAGGITNSGTITATAHTGISVVGGSTFAGGIVGNGSIVAGAYGIKLSGVSNFSGGISSGSIVATANTGIAVSAVSTFSGGITSNGNITAGQHGIFLDAGTVSKFTGDIVNHGTITAGNNFDGIRISSGGSPPLTVTGNIINTGTINASGVGGGIVLATGGILAGGVSNSGTISVGAPFGAIAIAATPSFGSNTLGLANSGSIFAGGLAAIFINVVDTFSGGITNSGTISNSGNFGIFVNGVSTFSGGLSNSGAITGNTGIVIGGGVTFAGAINNTGNITGTGGTAISVLGAPNAMTINQNAGTITGAIKLSTHADALNISGGVINGNIVGAGVSDTINFTLGAGSFTYGNAFTTINQVNVASGTVILNGTGNTATNVAVNGGMLEVGDGSHLGATLTSTNPLDVFGTLSGHGTVIGGATIESGGTLAPGGSIGTLSITGPVTFNSGSHYGIELSPTQHSQTSVTGIVTINGGNVILTPQFGTYGATTFAILTSTGTVSGTFSPTIAYTGSLHLTGATLTYDANHVYLTYGYTTPTIVLPTNGNGANGNENERNVANAINGFILGGGVLPTGFLNIAPLSGGALLAALDQLSGQAAPSFTQGGFMAGNLFLNLMLNPFNDSRSGDGGFGPPLGYAQEQSHAAATDAFASINKAPAKATFDRRYGVWAAAYGGNGRISGDAIITGSTDTTSRVFGFAAGLDYRLTPDSVIGFAVGGGGTNWGLAQGLGGGRSDMMQAGLYGSHRWGAGYVSGALAYSAFDVTTNRTVTVAGSDTLSANFKAHSLSGRLEGGYRFGFGSLGVTPYAAGQAQWISLPTYAESATSGSSTFALTYASQTATQTRSELGAWLDSKYLMAGGASLKLYSRAAWVHNFNTSAATTALFQTLPGTSFTVNTAKPSADAALLTGGAEYRFGNGWSVLGKLDGEFSKTTTVYAGTGTIKKVW